MIDVNFLWFFWVIIILKFKIFVGEGEGVFNNLIMIEVGNFYFVVNLLYFKYLKFNMIFFDF